MPRNVDFRCSACSFHENDIFCAAGTARSCQKCHKPMDEIWWAMPNRDNTQWNDKDAVVVFKKPDGTFSYPIINSKPTPQGCERLVMRSLREVERFEKLSGVRNEAMWYDRNGRGFDTDSVR